MKIVLLGLMMGLNICFAANEMDWEKLSKEDLTNLLITKNCSSEVIRNVLWTTVRRPVVGEFMNKFECGNVYFSTSNVTESSFIAVIEKQESRELYRITDKKVVTKIEKKLVALYDQSSEFKTILRLENQDILNEKEEERLEKEKIKKAINKLVL